MPDLSGNVHDVRSSQQGDIVGNIKERLSQLSGTKGGYSADTVEKLFGSDLPQLLERLRQVSANQQDSDDSELVQRLSDLLSQFQRASSNGDLDDAVADAKRNLDKFIDTLVERLEGRPFSQEPQLSHSTNKVATDNSAQPDHASSLNPTLHEPLPQLLECLASLARAVGIQQQSSAKGAVNGSALHHLVLDLLHRLHDITWDGKSSQEASAVPSALNRWADKVEALILPWSGQKQQSQGDGAAAGSSAQPQCLSQLLEPLRGLTTEQPAAGGNRLATSPDELSQLMLRLQDLADSIPVSERGETPIDRAAAKGAVKVTSRVRARRARSPSPRPSHIPRRMYDMVEQSADQM